MSQPEELIREGRVYQALNLTERQERLTWGHDLRIIFSQYDLNTVWICLRHLHHIVLKKVSKQSIRLKNLF